MQNRVSGIAGLQNRVGGLEHVIYVLIVDHQRTAGAFE